MKNKMIVIICFLTLLISCSSSDDSNGQCSETFDLLTQSEWKAEESFFSDMTFTTNGEYYEDGVYDGTWSLSNDCESIEFETEAGFDFSFRILEITENSLSTSLTTYNR